MENSNQLDDVDVEELETFMTDISDFANYGQIMFKSLKEKISWTTSTLRLVNDINNKLRDKVEYLKEHNNLLIDEILEYVNENKSLPADSNITDDMIFEHSHKAKNKESNLSDKVIRLIDEIYKMPLPETFIREYIDSAEAALVIVPAWYYISTYQKLSIEFLRELRHKVYWEFISQADYINEDYIRTFKDELYWHILDKHSKITDELRKEYSYKF